MKKNCWLSAFVIGLIVGFLHLPVRAAVTVEDKLSFVVEKIDKQNFKDIPVKATKRPRGNDYDDNMVTAALQKAQNSTIANIVAICVGDLLLQSISKALDIRYLFDTHCVGCGNEDHLCLNEVDSDSAEWAKRKSNSIFKSIPITLPLGLLLSLGGRYNLIKNASGAWQKAVAVATSLAFSFVNGDFFKYTFLKLYLYNSGIKALKKKHREERAYMAYLRAQN
jgi:hypothetical protein